VKSVSYEQHVRFAAEIDMKCFVRDAEGYKWENTTSLPLRLSQVKMFVVCLEGEPKDACVLWFHLYTLFLK